jgi:transcriptional regulator with XRE-family HTH domain
LAWQDEGCQRLDKALEDARLSNAAVAREMGVDPSLVSRWRSGERVPDAEQLRRVLVMAGASADYVLGLSPDPRAVQRVGEQIARWASVTERVAPKPEGKKR